MIFATAPCQPFSSARPVAGWNSAESAPFAACINLIGTLFQHQNPLTFFVENVPNSAKFPDIQDSLGQPIVLEAHRLGSSSFRKTAIWTNCADYPYLNTRYQLDQHQGIPIQEFLQQHGFFEWQVMAHNTPYFPKFMTR